MKNRLSIIRFRSYNPYEALYPNRRVVSRQTLHLIKLIRTQGFKVVVEPDDGTSLNFVAEKGLREFLSDPIYATVVGVSVSVVTNLVCSWLYDQLKRDAKADEVNIILEFDERGEKVRYSYNGEPMSDARFLALLTALNERAKRYKESRQIVSPDLTRPISIHLEHTGKVVGWGHLAMDDVGLKVKDAKITDEETWQRVKRGELKGFSIAGLVHSAICQVCDGQYVDCNHISGEEYNGVKCSVRIDGISLAEVSIVTTPINPAAIIERAF